MHCDSLHLILEKKKDSNETTGKRVYLIVMYQYGFLGFPGNARGKNPPANEEDIRDPVWSPSWKDPLMKGMATHASILAWRKLWTEKPYGCQYLVSQNFGHDWSNFACNLACKYSFLALTKGSQKCKMLKWESVDTAVYSN